MHTFRLNGIYVLIKGRVYSHLVTSDITKKCIGTYITQGGRLPAAISTAAVFRMAAVGESFQG